MEIIEFEVHFQVEGLGQITYTAESLFSPPPKGRLDPILVDLSALYQWPIQAEELEKTEFYPALL